MLRQFTPDICGILIDQVKSGLLMLEISKDKVLFDCLLFYVTILMPLSSPQGMDLDEFPPILSLGFSSPTVDNEEPLSFGTLLACLNMALSNLGPVSLVTFASLLT